VRHAVGEDLPREVADRDELFGGGEVHGDRPWRGRAGQGGVGPEQREHEIFVDARELDANAHPDRDVGGKRCPRGSTPRRVPSSSSISAIAFGYENGGTGGWCATTKLNTWPRPAEAIASQSSDWQCGHIGPGGWRSALAAVQRWIRSSPAATPCQKKALSRDCAGRGRRRGLSAGDAACAAGAAGGLELEDPERHPGDLFAAASR